MADDLTKQALAAAKAGTDLYALVGDVSPTAPVEDIRRAWRKRNLVLHPDKARDAFDPELYGRFSEALAVLENAEARTAYDGAIAAAQAQKRRHDEMDGERRRMVEDLLAREKAAAGGGASQQQQKQKQKESAEERKRREMREMKEHDHQRLEQERERLRKEDEDSRARARRDEDDRLRRKEEEIERKIRDKKKRRQRREQAHAGRVARDGVPTSGPDAWAWTRRMLVQEQRLRDARAAAQAQS